MLLGPTVSTSQIAETGKVVVLHYTMMDEQGAPLASTRGKDPIALRLGDGQLLLGLEESLIGLNGKAGDRFRIFVPAARAYGPRTGSGPRAVARRELPKGIELRPGVWIEIPGSDGVVVKLWITKVQGKRVWLDTDHPLAGQNLIFDVELLEVRARGPGDVLTDPGPPFLPNGPKG